MFSDRVISWIALIMIVIISITSGYFFGVYKANENCKNKAIKHNCAQFDTKTGDFMWMTQD